MKNHTFKRLFGYLKDYRLRLFFVLLFAGVFVSGIAVLFLFAGISYGKDYSKCNA